ncbi:uncharacterized protein MONOS_1961 [Monocercomonoides exilis]|uniref:uncharacterized protein n=1 Tax=Monocercomonoides exilis TaxID=2049356 RepID=UPI003559A689|nr:hypothetical protein MONOS_1961 [Monocercomonoides exilis]|eukprot:MONOS_1961.1-p1 / transcript=MONOS_1961.1 / gene=MONOS_1961 / organism=Monocercomonoides_exilis_PA203 / gene_product=unspecified product / transcript_product=unspecified product / location=Mono_scaffold00037:168657-181161(-) / protein_length=4133 / sequence_SO=supercontig / SO=protein_coding / is_pseudo=false
MRVGLAKCNGICILIFLVIVHSSVQKSVVAQEGAEKGISIDFREKGRNPFERGLNEMENENKNLVNEVQRSGRHFKDLILNGTKEQHVKEKIEKETEKETRERREEYIDNKDLLISNDKQQDVKSIIRCLIGAWNSSVAIRKLQVVGSEKGKGIDVGRNSFLHFECVEMMMECADESPILCIGGRILLENTSLKIVGEEKMMPPMLHPESWSRSENELGEAKIIACSFGSFSLWGSSPFIVSPALGNAEVIGSRFANITVWSQWRFVDGGQYNCKTRLECVEFMRVEDVLDGAIVPPLSMPSSSVVSRNCTYQGNIRHPNKYDIFNGSEGRRELDASASFEDDTFEGCRTDTGSGGALSVKSSFMLLSVTRCNFTGCYAYTGGGAIDATTSKGAMLIEIFFLNNTSETQGGSLNMAGNNGCTITQKCLFKNNRVNEQGRGSAFCLSVYPIDSPTSCLGSDDGNGGQAQVIDCQFVKCLNKGNYGAVMSWSYSSIFAMRSCQFIKCSAVKEGGAIRHHFVKCPGDQTNLKAFFFLFFHECSCTNGENPLGHDVYLTQTSSNVNITSTPFKESYTTNTNEKRLFHTGTGKYEKDWLPTTKKLFTSCFVSTSGNDGDELCGLSDESGCRTISHSLGKCMTQFESRIFLGKGTHISEAGEISAGIRELSVCGEGVEETVVSTSSMMNGDSMFSVTSGRVFVSLFTIEHSHAKHEMKLFVVRGSGSVELKRMRMRPSNGHSSLNAFGASLIMSGAGEGKVGMEQVEIGNFVLEDAPIVGVEGKWKVTISFTTFRNIVRLRGDGSVISKNVAEGEVLQMNNVTMQGCRCESGDGGGIVVRMESGACVRVGNESEVLFGGCEAREGQSSGGGCGGGMMIEVKEGGYDFVIERASFAGCVATKAGSKLFVRGPRLAEVAKRERLKFAIDESNLSEVCGFENGDEANVIPLVVYLRSKPSEYHVGGLNKRDWEMCGFGDVQCASVDYAIRKHGTGAGITVVANSGAVVKGEVELMNGVVVVKGQASPPRVVIESRESGRAEGVITTAGATTSIVNLVISLPASVGEGRSVIACRSGSVEVRQCNFEGGEGERIEYVVMQCIGGKLSVRQVAVSGLSFGGSCMVCVSNNGEGLISQTNISGGTVECENGLVYYASSGKLVVEQTKFEGIRCSLSGIVVGRGGSNLEIEKCTFSRIESTAGNGSGVRCVIGDGESVVIGNSSFSGCCVKKGCGGGVCMEIEAGGYFRMGRSEEETLVEKCRSSLREGVGGCGGGMFLKMEGGSESKGWDYEVCGVAFGTGVGKNEAVRGGDNVFVEAEDLSEAVSGRKFVGVIATDKGRVREAMGFEGGDESFLIPLMFFMIEVEGIAEYVGGVNERDFSGCGFEGYGCATIGKLVGLRFANSEKKIIVNEGFSWSEKVEMSGQKWELKGVERGTNVNVVWGEAGVGNGMIHTTTGTQMANCTFGVLVKSEAVGSLIECIGGDLEMMWCVMRLSGEEGFDGVSGGLLKVEGGGVILDEFVVEGSGEIGFMGVPIDIGGGGKMKVNNSVFGCAWHRGGDGGCIGVESGPGQLRDVHVENCTIKGKCRGGNGLRGGGMIVNQGEGAEVVIEGTKFEGCEVPEGEGEGEGGEGRGLGGGVFLLCSDGVSGFELKGLEFEVCKAWKGKNVFVEGKDLSVIVSGGSMNFERGGMEMGDLMGYERCSTGDTFGIPLVAYLDKFGGTAYVGGESDWGYDHSGCGMAYAPCRTIKQALKVRFGGVVGSGEVVAMESFELKDHVVLELQGVKLKGVIEGGETSVHVRNDGTGEGEGLLETRVNVFVKNISFAVPNEFSAARWECLFACKGEELKLENCQVEQVNGQLKMKYSLIKASGGKVVVNGLKMKNMNTGEFELFELCGGEGVFEGLEIENVVCGAESGLIGVREGSALRVENSTVKGTTMDDGSVVAFEERASVFAKNISVEGKTRKSGNGGVFAGRVGEGQKVEVKESTFVQDVCMGNPSCGGCAFVSVAGKGEFVFDSNRVERCAVVGTAGYGGGVFAELEDREAKYSLREDVFEGNAAAKGLDVFVVCGEPEVMLREDLWMGTVDEESTPEVNVWVVDSVTGTVIDLSVKKYLFPVEGAIVYVEAGRSTAADSCGSEISPCDRFIDGFMNMGEEKTTIQMNNGNWMDYVIDRKGKSLAVRGKSAGCSLEVREHGCFRQSIGDSQTTLTLSRLNFRLPEVASEEVDGLISVSVGMVIVMNCAFGAGSGTDAGEEEAGADVRWETWMRIVRETGGEVRMNQVAVEGVSFGVDGGFVKMEGGMLIMNNTNISNVGGTGKGLIEGSGEAEFGMHKGCVEEVDATDGGVVWMENVRSVEITEGSTFNGCQSAHGDGGGVHCEVSEGSSLCITDGALESCCVNGESGRGGGIYLNVASTRMGDMNFDGLEFAENAGACGRDVFVECEDLNKTVTRSRFRFAVKNGEGEVIVDMKGVDRVRFVEEAVELVVFLVEHKWGEVHVREGGCDMIGCGSEKMPCETFWRGVKNADRETVEGAKILVKGKMRVADWFDVSGIRTVCNGAGTGAVTRCVMEIGEEISGGDGKCVFENSERAGFEGVEFVLPEMLASGQEVVLLSETEDGALSMTDCIFQFESGSVMRYGVMKTSGGKVELVGCSIEKATFSESAFEFRSNVMIEGCAMKKVKAPEEKEGGGMKMIVKGEQTLMLKNTTAEECECSVAFGRGGFLFVDCSGSLIVHPFKLKEVSFKLNSAKVGEHMFVLARDLNKTVTTTSFGFDYQGMKENGNGFVGSDESRNETDLLRYVVGFKSRKIHVSSEGQDVMRCGNVDDPCETLWKGMEQVERTEEMKEIVVEGEARVEDDWTMKNMVVSGVGGEGEEEDVKDELVFSGKGGESVLSEDPFIAYAGTLCVRRMKMVVGGSGGVEKKGVLSGSGTLLEMERCVVGGAGSGGELCGSVVVVKAGVLVVVDVRFERMKVKGCVMMVFEGVSCNLREVRMSSQEYHEGCAISVVSSSINDIGRLENAGGMSGTSVTVNGSTFVMAEREDDGPCVVESVCGGSVKVVVNESTFESCKAGESKKGGVVEFRLNEGGEFRMKGGKIVQSSCSITQGRGGGVYLGTELGGDLNFVFEKVSLSGNNAFVGRDIFVECANISRQINESQFKMDLRQEVYIQGNAIYGVDKRSETPVNLMDLITVYQAATIVVSSVLGKGGRNWRKCGTVEQPCLTLGYGLDHVVAEFNSMLAVDGESEVEMEIDILSMVVRSKSWEMASVKIGSGISYTREYMIGVGGSTAVELVEFKMPRVFPTSHASLFWMEEGNVMFDRVRFSSLEGDGHKASVPILMKCASGKLEMRGCEMEDVCGECLLRCGGAVTVRQLRIGNVECQGGGIVVREGSMVIDELKADRMRTEKGSVVEAEEAAGGDGASSVQVSRAVFVNISSAGENAAAVTSQCERAKLELSNCSFEMCQSLGAKGGVIGVWKSRDVVLDGCRIDGSETESTLKVNADAAEEICRWNGSVADISESEGKVRDTTIWNAHDGALSVSGGEVTIEKGEFLNNNPSITKYPSVRRNIVCSGSGTLDVKSLKGGDGLERNTSLWILNDGCVMRGIGSERESVLFIPILRSVETEENEGTLNIVFRGTLLLPCNLSFMIVKQVGEEKEIVKYSFLEEGYVSETEVKGIAEKELVRSCGEDTEVSVCILFGDAKNPSSTDSFILKNKSEPKTNGDERISEGGKEGKSSWLLIVIVLSAILLVVLISLVMRAEREAEKKNEERMKKRIYEKSLGHSESSEHLLSESGSTEYILGKDSDKIPEWALEKVEEKEEEEIRKRTPSPSISSTSTTDTSDTESTFVRSESLCPTTSSMSNLVDAMACSSPHEKLIVDLRDSLFMLLHGKNKTKEMAIGTFQEREQTAAQILFWVANLALHSFDEMENPLQSLSNLSPHIVLFSEHMVICIVIHSDFLSSDDSDSSSISSSTVVTSTSDDDDDDSDSLPSSAFEDEDDYYKKECLRWKAPELLMNKKMGATKESVVFSIGMMLWECLTLQIPFGDYEGEVAGQKIVNGERQGCKAIEGSSLCVLIGRCEKQSVEERPSLNELKREFIQRFPAGAVMLTISDAIGLNTGYDGDRRINESGRSGSESCSTTSIHFITDSL